MADYPNVETDVVVDPDQLRMATTEVFSACGMRGDDARLLAETLVQSDLRGIHSHGVLRVPDYMAKLKQFGVDPAGRPCVTSDRGGALRVDGGNSMGQIGLSFAMREAIGRARSLGIAFVAVDNSNHCGALDYYVRMAVAEGMIGLCGTNALPTMAPWGGREKIVGINPLAIGIPGGKEGDFVLDIAFGETAHGKIRVYAQKNAPIPGDWAFDSEGHPTTDAKRALEGLIRPIGAHKGVGLGMAIGMLSTVLSTACYGTRLGNMVDGPVAGGDGHFCVAIDCAAFTDPSSVRGKVDEILREVRSSAKSANTPKLLTPGEMEAAFSARRSRTGLPLARDTIDGLIAAAKSAGADISEFADRVGSRER